MVNSIANTPIYNKTSATHNVDTIPKIKIIIKAIFGAGVSSVVLAVAKTALLAIGLSTIATIGIVATGGAIVGVALLLYLVFHFYNNYSTNNSNIQNNKNYSTNNANLTKSVSPIKTPLRNENKVNHVSINSPIGMKNLGNTCFINSALQAILNNPDLVNACLNHQNQEFRKSFTIYHKDMSNSNNLSNLVDTIQSQFGLQQFAQDSSMMLLTRIFADSQINSFGFVSDNGQVTIQPNYLAELANANDLLNTLSLFNYYSYNETKRTMVLCNNAYDSLLSTFKNNRLFQNTYQDFLENMASNDDLKSDFNQFIKSEYFKNQVKKPLVYDLSGVIQLDSNMSVDTSFIVNPPTHTQISSIIIHIGNVTGGHYFAFVKKPEGWYLCNDNNIKFISDSNEGFQAYLLQYLINDSNSSIAGVIATNDDI